MRIAITADPEIPVPPQLYGGIERIIDMLVRGLAERGHEVTLIAHPDSRVPVELVPYPGLRPRHPLDTLRNSWTVARTLTRGRYDLVHAFGRLAYLLPILPWELPKLMSYQREPTLSGIQRAVQLSKKGSLAFTGCSEYIAAKIRPYAPAYAIHNGVPLQVYKFQPQVMPDAPLVFLGRVEHVKGAHLAIEIARQTGKKLILAGNVPNDGQFQRYFQEQIQPQLDGQQIQYIGPVNDQQKNELLGRAAAFLMPILWDEPFGIVMAEALACGTPVIGMRRGAVPEVVQPGVNGFIGNTLPELVASVYQIDQIERYNCRKSAELCFSDRVIVGQYEHLYQTLIARS